jgi:glycerol-3-phosphate dehydrogenase (NAD(P)+)
MGLAGLGDLVLTCTDEQSRNRRFGLSLARGASAAGAAALIGQVVEGAQAARAVREVAARRGVEMPICHEVFRIMHEGRDIREAALALMGREMRAEQD